MKIGNDKNPRWGRGGGGRGRPMKITAYDFPVQGEIVSFDNFGVKNKK